MEPLLSLVIPAFNEAKNLPLIAARVRAAFHRSDIEVIIVDNGSVDESPRVLAELLAGDPVLRSVRVEINQGYGFGILFGLKAARGRILAWTHADMQTDPADVLRGLEFFEGVADPSRLFVKGRRFGRPIADVVFTMGMAAFETTLLGVPLWDINAQPTMFHRSFFETWRDPPHDFALDLYAYHRARVAGLEIRRYPVAFGERAHGHSHWNVNWQAKMKFIRRTVGFSLRLRRDLGRGP
ncbi:MAG: glycosyltransferase family 2 protein [Alphaproteobacteria bacterium]|nr:glycosyltransferase family 2 protein [Alphaproteobacteria bacterium]